MDGTRTALGAVGIWSMELRGASRPEVREAAAELDERGYRALWIPGLDGRGALDDLGQLLDAAPHAGVVLGVLSMWGQQPEEEDLIPGGSDRLIDALVAWGDLDDVARRIRAHLDAGADHVALHVLRPDGGGALPLPQWRELAALLPTFAAGAGGR